MYVTLILFLDFLKVKDSEQNNIGQGKDLKKAPKLPRWNTRPSGNLIHLFVFILQENATKGKVGTKQNESETK